MNRKEWKELDWYPVDVLSRLKHAADTFNKREPIECYTDEKGNSAYAFAVPGFTKDDLVISVCENVILITGSKDFEFGQKEYFNKLIITTGSDVTASMKDGILYIKLIDEQREERKITID